MAEGDRREKKSEYFKYLEWYKGRNDLLIGYVKRKLG
jgi:hypothetical protein